MNSTGFPDVPQVAKAAAAAGERETRETRETLGPSFEPKVAAGARGMAEVWCFYHDGLKGTQIIWSYLVDFIQKWMG